MKPVDVSSLLAPEPVPVQHGKGPFAIPRAGQVCERAIEPADDPLLLLAAERALGSWRPTVVAPRSSTAAAATR